MAACEKYPISNCFRVAISKESIPPRHFDGNSVDPQIIWSIFEFVAGSTGSTRVRLQAVFKRCFSVLATFSGMPGSRF